MKLSDVIKDGHTRSKDGGNDIENRHRQLLEKLDSQNQYLLHALVRVFNAIDVVM